MEKPAQSKGAFDDMDDDFEGLEDAKEGSADDDFANISRSGLEDYNPVFDSSPPPSQTKSESAFGNESSFDFIPSNPPEAPPNQQQQKDTTNDAHDWDAIFSGLDSSDTVAPTLSGDGSKPTGERPAGPGRALTDRGEHDDPILKSLTGMGYSRNDAVAALEKYDYNLERVCVILYPYNPARL
jgi:epidermal growth factor receptor substrate 15